jgi:hypothetical protein
MAQIPPNPIIIRTYPIEDTFSDPGSETAQLIEWESEDEDQLPIQDRLTQNQEYMDRQLALRGEGKWNLLPTPDVMPLQPDVMLIVKPTASYMSHRLLNPYVYRNIRNLGTLQDLADLLNTPNDWESHYNRVIRIDSKMDEFENLPEDAPEIDIQSVFLELVVLVVFCPRVKLVTRQQTKIVMGGILARYPYDLRSQTDVRFMSTNRARVRVITLKCVQSNNIYSTRVTSLVFVWRSVFSLMEISSSILSITS